MEQYLEHHGILGQRWGVRRFQNPDGSLTKAGQKRYGEEGSRTAKQTQDRLNDLEKAVAYNQRAYNKSYNKITKMATRQAARATMTAERVKKMADKEKAKELINKSLNPTKHEKKVITKNGIKIAEANAMMDIGKDEIKNILEKTGQYKIDSKITRINTSRAYEKMGTALGVVGGLSLGVVPGPNIAGVAVIATTLAKADDRKIYGYKYKVSNKEVSGD